MPSPSITTRPIASPLAEPRIRAAIARAADHSGVDFGFLYNQARIESGFDPQAKARTSSAAGLFQFTRQTWLQVVKAHGDGHGAAWAAAAIERRGSALQVADPQLRTAIDDLRYDPEFASAMAAEFAADNRAQLASEVGHDVAPVDLYLAHFLGSSGAADFLAAHAANPDAAAAPLFPAAAAANRAVFYGPDGVAKSLGDIRASFAAKLDGAAPPARQPTQTRYAEAVNDARAPLQLASIEPMPPQLSVDYAARAYRRLAGLGA